jgi:hypothetical protein
VLVPEKEGLSDGRNKDDNDSVKITLVGFEYCCGIAMVDVLLDEKATHRDTHIANNQSSLSAMTSIWRRVPRVYTGVESSRG